MGEHLKKILIVDDELLIRQGILHYIDWQEEGFEIVGEASNGQEALERIAEVKPDIIITDIAMPVMDGIELIKTVKRESPEIEFVVLSSYSDFDYVRETFKSGVLDYILKPNLNAASLLETLKMSACAKKPDTPDERGPQKELSPEALIRKIMHRHYSRQDVENLKKCFSGNSFALIEVHASWLAADGTAAPAHTAGLDMVKIDDDAAEKEGMLYLANGSMENIHRYLEHRKQENDGRTLLASRTFTDLDLIGIHYREDILKLRQHYFYLSDAPILTIQSLPETTGRPKPFDLNYCLVLFKQKKLESAMQHIDAHLDEIKGSCLLEQVEVKNFLGNLVFNMTVALSAMVPDNQKIEQKKYQYFDAINHASTFEEAHFHFRTFFSEAIAKINESGEEPLSNFDRLLAYIEAHYQDPLSLTELAKHFHFNASYLSSYFSQHMGQGFNEYLTTIRMENAKRLLGESDWSIAEVGAMVGYPDHSYFCKVFKRRHHLSPSRYRKEKKHEREHWSNQ
ncbi:response regulator transcription factor [Anaerotalea alkaliphila]|uniref:Stage 0 sporulation protein A homolog n=1 Tax=Anaerotalea alkaliphila TaxID=2662126 RepID=A0A7X5HUW9_9FIRM|nr:response regulator transcription factor [Anaerotalea alkaliphila]NDL67030.1 response regulator transcription factor [Anaerotalea alkaliphila]